MTAARHVLAVLIFGLAALLGVWGAWIAALRFTRDYQDSNYLAIGSTVIALAALLAGAGWLLLGRGASTLVRVGIPLVSVIIVAVILNRLFFGF